MKVIPKILLTTLLMGICVFGQQLNAQVVRTTASTTDFVFTRNLSMGIRGNDVFALQQFLIAGKFLNLTTPTGYFGPATKTAVMLWQRSVGISPPSGFFGLLSRGKINTPATIAPMVIKAQSTSTIATTSISLTTNGSPLRLNIPKLGIDAAFQYNGLTALGIMEIPNNVTDVGWYTGSPHPGEKGAAIITGHVAQIRGGIVTKQGVFVRLGELLPGDTFTIRDDRGLSKTFIVRESHTYDPAADTTDIFSPSDNEAHLRLITCEGVWEADKQSFTKRLVVFADLLK